MSEDFDEACNKFTQACQRAAHWKHSFHGAAYYTRIEAAYQDVQKAFIAVHRANMSPMDREVLKTLDEIIDNWKDPGPFNGGPGD